MIVCLCRGISEREIEDTIRRGARTFEDVTRGCAGAGSCCGTCRPLIERQLRQRECDESRAA